MKLKYILPAVLAVIIAFAYYSDPVDSPEPEVKHVIKLTTRHLPINKYIPEEDDDDSLTVSQLYLIARRETALKARVDIAPTEDDVEISDGVRLRLLLARMKALDRYKQLHS